MHPYSDYWYGEYVRMKDKYFATLERVVKATKRAETAEAKVGELTTTNAALQQGVDELSAKLDALKPEDLAPFKVGDLVKGRYNERFFKVEKIEKNPQAADGSWRVRFQNHLGWFTVDMFELAEAPFKVGDKVKGTAGTVYAVHDIKLVDSTWRVQLANTLQPDHIYTGFWPAENYTLVPEEDPPFKVGDKIYTYRIFITFIIQSIWKDLDGEWWVRSAGSGMEYQLSEYNFRTVY